MKHMTLMKYTLTLSALLTLSGCFSGGLDVGPFGGPAKWTMTKEKIERIENAETLQGWWKKFDDDTLNALVDLALADSPDRKIAEARILEARGLRRTAKSKLFPQINASTSAGREDTGSDDAGRISDLFEAGFDASFELDIFGANRNAFSAADERLIQRQAEYHDISLTLIAEVVRGYINYRNAQNQYRIAEKNLALQEKTLELIGNLFELGAAPRLDVERAKNLVNTTRASLPEFKRQENNARLGLSVLTGQMPDALMALLETDAEIPGANVQPLLMAPAQVLSLRPDIQAAEANLLAATDLAESATAEFFPSITLGGFYGVVDNALITSASVWSIVAGAAVNLLDFGRIEGQIDAARAREKQAYELYRKTVVEAVVEVETAMNDYTQISQRRVSLNEAFAAAQEARTLSETLYKEGEIAFLDVLEAQRSANEAEAQAITAKAAQAESLTRLFKSLGVY